METDADTYVQNSLNCVRDFNSIGRYGLYIRTQFLIECMASRSRTSVSGLRKSPMGIGGEEIFVDFVYSCIYDTQILLIPLSTRCLLLRRQSEAISSERSSVVGGLGLIGCSLLTNSVPRAWTRYLSKGVGENFLDEQSNTEHRLKECLQ